MLPNLIIIGAMKCGTTSLHEYLSYHPDIFMSQRKEINFFVAEHNWHRGLGWYEAHFEGATQRVIGESSPNYTRQPFYPGVPERIHGLLPEAKLIYCVRDPVKRFLSHYTHSYSLGREDRTVEQVAAGPSPYLECSRYYAQLEAYLEFYHPSQIKVVALEALNAAPEATLQEVFAFLEVPPHHDPRFCAPSATMPPSEQRRRSPLKSWMVRRHMRGVYWTERNLPWLFGPPLKKPELSARSLGTLQEALAEDVARLEAFAGQRFGWNVPAPARVLELS